MSTLFKTGLAAIALSLTALAAHAQSAPAEPLTPKIDQRQAHQEQRIEQGKASGQLTPREARRLEKRQARIAAAETQAKADGTITRAERKQLRHKLDRSGRDIRREKHDAQTAPPASVAPR